jgi:pimeloyl-ACP methyl ester carboxylesterase
VFKRYEGFANVNGTRLHFEATGTGPTVVLVHGHTLDLRMWDGQFEPLAQRYRVLLYDARGYGQSALPTDEPYSHAADLRGLWL